MDQDQAAELNEPVSLNGHGDENEAHEREPDRGLVYEILREFRALGVRDE